MRNCLTGKFNKKGFSLVEMLAVVAIMVILCGIVMVAIFSLQKSMRFKECNDYAKTIFMAAQANLSAMRSSGELGELMALEDETLKITEDLRDKVGFPAESWTGEYVYTSSELVQPSIGFETYSMVLPVNSVEGHLRDQKVIIEYNPITGNVYSVFYSEDSESMLAMYRAGKLPRDEDARRELEIGYYCGSILNSKGLDLGDITVTATYVNGEEGYVSILIPIPEGMTESSFRDALDVTLNITSKTDATKTVSLAIMRRNAADIADCIRVDNDLHITYILDSLKEGKSFANFGTGDYAGNNSLTSIKNESAFTFIPGENVTIQPVVNYTSGGTSIKLNTDTLPTVNPMFGGLSDSVLTVSNGRNLQNLNALAPSIADGVKEVLFTKNIDWNTTVTHYNNEYAEGGTYKNTTEAPARALPYFVPIHNERLLGTAKFSGNELDMTSVGSDYAVINGDGKTVRGLNIDSVQCPSGTAYYVTAGGKQVVNYHLTGLFAYVNTTVQDLTVVNSKIKGMSFSKAGGNVATGTLAGAAGHNAFFNNCGTYMEQGSVADYSATSGPKEYNAGGDQTWYGVSGEGSVGGLVGYSVSYREADGYLTGAEKQLAFLKCFSAVPVSGNMRGTGTSGYGYVNGVGGLVGVTKLSNFYACYASGDILASKVYTAKKSTSWSLITLDGTKSMGVGGLVGTSHGSMYSNCFTTGDVESDTTAGSGSFLGVMCYDVSFTANSKTYKQLTLMESCYTTGRVNGKTGSAFTGGNASVDLGSHLNSADKVYTDYYLMAAPYYAVERNIGTINDNYEYIANEYNAARDITAITIPLSPDGYTIRGTSVTFRYLAKDCYYLDQSRSELTITPRSDSIGTAVCYDTLMKLVASHSGGSAWIENQWNSILEWPALDGKTFEMSYIILKVWGVDYYDTFTALENLYRTQLGASFTDTLWVDEEQNEEENTYNDGKYIFPMFEDMMYYGDWPTLALTGGLAYFEYYDNDTDIHAQFDRADEGDLLTNDELRAQGTAVISDGYAAASRQKPTKVTVKIGTATARQVSTCIEWVNPAGEKLYLYPFTAQYQLEPAAAQAGDFYTKAVITMTFSSGTKEYVTYFNPYAANTQVNPVMIDANNHVVPEEPGVPAYIEIRTARQLGGLATTQMQKKWGQNYNYIQTMDIDGTKYTATKGYSTVAEQRRVWRLFKTEGIYTCSNTTGIGTAANPFTGTYTGIGVGDEKPVITNLFTRRLLGIFGNVGEPDAAATANGKISNLTIRVAADTVWSKYSKDCDGLLAMENYGIIEDVDIELQGAFTTQATTNAGLLAGKSTGIIRDCDITGAGNVTMTAATTAGGITGALTGTVDGCTVDIKGTLTTNAVNGGGLAGTAQGADIKNSTVKLNGLPSTTASTNLGGLAGILTGGKCTAVDVTVGGTSGGSGFAAIGGMATEIDGTTVQNSSVTVSGTLQAVNAAALAPTVKNASVKNCTITISGTVEGSSAAAGMAASTVGTGEFTANLVVLNNGTITSSDKAAGFAVDLAGTCAQSKVELNGGTITGKLAAGFAHTITAQVSNNCAVMGSGTINGTSKAAGFVVELTGSVALSRVTPSVIQNTGGYWGNSNDKLVVNGPTAAGFAVNIASGAAVRNCDALCKVTGTTISGFADSNSGQIDGCIANVTITKGYAFVRQSPGYVYSSYGWYGDGSTSSSTTVPSSGNYFSCYFVDTDVTNQSTACVAFFSNKGKYSLIKLAGLKEALDDLSNNVGAKWYVTGTFGSYPYKMSTAYPYPMLREHCGDWAPVS